MCIAPHCLCVFVTWKGLRKENTRQAEDILLMYTSLVGPPGPHLSVQVLGGRVGSGGVEGELVRRDEVECVMWGCQFGL